MNTEQFRQSKTAWNSWDNPDSVESCDDRWLFLEDMERLARLRKSQESTETFRKTVEKIQKG